mmetsp:Transcript_83317/g.241087  ORF Transcript_83317/g.241087 Transcript_83317/m.241087 type:complete len:211 (+) Transcript_83317:194-826(+)
MEILLERRPNGKRSFSAAGLALSGVSSSSCDLVPIDGPAPIFVDLSEDCGDKRLLVERPRIDRLSDEKHGEVQLVGPQSSIAIDVRLPIRRTSKIQHARVQLSCNAPRSENGMHRPYELFLVDLAAAVCVCVLEEPGYVVGANLGQKWRLRGSTALQRLDQFEHLPDQIRGVLRLSLAQALVAVDVAFGEDARPPTEGTLRIAIRSEASD